PIAPIQEQTSFSSPVIAENTQKPVIYKVAALGLAVFLTGIWIGRLVSSSNEPLLWEKGFPNPDIAKLQSENNKLINQIQILKAENSFFEQEKVQVQEAKAMNKGLRLKLDELQEMELENKNLTQYSNELSKSITEKDKELKILELDSL